MQYAVDHFHACKTLYNTKPRQGHRSDVQAFLEFFVVIVQIESYTSQKKFISLVRLSGVGGKNTVETRRKRRFMYRHGFIKVEMFFDHIGCKIVFKKINTL